MKFSNLNSHMYNIYKFILINVKNLSKNKNN